MNCATAGCVVPSTGKSKYCREHAKVARAAWLAQVQASVQAREERNEAHASLWARAIEAARKAHAEAIPVPMTVFDANLDGSPKADGNRYYVSEGACGFGSVILRPANSSFAIWACKNAGFHKAYSGGVRFSTNFNGSQSIARAEAAAWAAAEVLREAGLKAYADSRLD